MMGGVLVNFAHTNKFFVSVPIVFCMLPGNFAIVNAPSSSFHCPLCFILPGIGLGLIDKYAENRKSQMPFFGLCIVFIVLGGTAAQFIFLSTFTDHYLTTIDR